MRFLMFVLFVALGAYFLRTDSGHAYAVSGREWFQSQGTAAAPAFTLFIALAVAVSAPWSWLTVFAGVLFPPHIAIPVASIGSTLGSGLAFLLSRYVLGQDIVRWLRSNDRFQRVDDLVHRRGALIVAITRLIPLFPANLMNYLFGLTCVRCSTFVFWVGVATLPEVVVLAEGGHVGTSALLHGHIAWGSLGIMAAVGALVAVLATRAWRSLNEEPSAGSS